MDSDGGSPPYFQSTLLSELRFERKRKRLRKAGRSIAESDFSKFASDPDLEDVIEENFDDYTTPALRDSETLSVEQSEDDCFMEVTGGGKVDCNTTDADQTGEDQNEESEGRIEKKTKKLKKMDMDSFTCEYDSSEFFPDPVWEHDGNQHLNGDSRIETLMGAFDGEKDNNTETAIESNEYKNVETPDRQEMVKNEAKRVRKAKPGLERVQHRTKISGKEKRKILTEFRAESQRLLREGGNVAFKPAPMVQKSVSCVLDKIRKRKRDISKASEDTQFNDVAGTDTQFNDVAGTDTQFNDVTETDTQFNDVAGTVAQIKEHKQGSESPKNVENHLKDNDSPDSSDTEETILAPSAIVNDLKNNGFAKDRKTAKRLSPVAQCFANEFLDDEAEEEPDSDDDNPQPDDDDEDEDESNGLDELEDLIATDFEENLDDKDNLNELHQKWLEQQDAAGTEKLLHKIGRSNAERELSPRQYEDSETDEFTVENTPTPLSNARLNLKKAKEMFHLLYTDTTDVYVSSDEEDRSTVDLEPGALEIPKMSEESLRIKKTNVSETKKKPKNNIIVETMSVNAPKMSFFGREVRSVSSLLRSGSSTGRSYIFERDAGVIGPEAYSSSPTVGAQKVVKRKVHERNEGSTKTGPSLHEILRTSTSKVSAASIDCNDDIKAFYASLAVSRYATKQSTASMR